MPLHLEPASRADIPALVALYFATFKSPLVRRLKPDVPSSREWYAAQLEQAIAKPHCSVYKVVERHTGDAYRGAGDEIIAFASWQAPHDEGSQLDVDGDGDGLVREDATTKWPAEGDPALFEEAVAKATSIRAELVGCTEHWYLSVLATLPQHQRRGAGSLLMGELCRRADAAKQYAYLEASPAGKPTYERFGFQVKGSFTTVIDGEGYVDSCMVREPRRSEVEEN